MNLTLLSLAQSFARSYKAFGMTFHKANTFCLFRISIFSWLFYQTAFLLPYASEVWGPTSLVNRSQFDGTILDYLTRFSIIPEIHQHYLWLIVAYLGVLISGIFFSSRILTILIFFLCQNVHALAPVLLDGGTNITELVLFYMMFISHRTPEFKTEFSPSYFISNVAMLLCALQVTVIYICAGIYKLNGNLWQNGMALYYILQSADYSHPIASEFVIKHPKFSTLSTYYAIAFQYAFPFLVWPRATRPWILLMGTVLHLGIAFIMGLFTFGLVMCIMYILFFEDHFSEKVLTWFSIKNKLHIGFDDNCKVCQLTKRWLVSFDFIGTIVPDSAQLPTHPRLASIDAFARLEAMKAVSASGNVYSGYQAIEQILYRIPQLLPIFPLIAILGFFGIGGLIYRIISKVLLNFGCRTGACTF